jgi:hypothetical protein
MKQNLLYLGTSLARYTYLIREARELGTIL